MDSLGPRSKKFRDKNCISVKRVYIVDDNAPNAYETCTARDHLSWEQKVLTTAI